jgi:peroxiredoxin
MEELLQHTLCESQSERRKSMFRTLIVGAHGEVERLLEIEEQLSDLELDPNKQIEVEELRAKHQQLEQHIDQHLTDGGVLRELLLQEYKSKQNANCGHKGRGVSCHKCQQCKYLCMDYAKQPERWLESITSKSRFTVLLFYRGSWCGNCSIYMKEANQIIRQIRELGGEAYAISSQNEKFVTEMKVDCDIDFEFFSDTECILAKKYDMKIVKKGSKVFNVFSRLAKRAHIEHMVLPFHDDGISQPGVVVIDDEGRVIYKCITPVTERSAYGMFDRADPKDVLEILKFYYSKPEIASSVQQYVIDNKSRAFEMVLADENLRMMFMKHLKKEFASESLEFLIDVEKFRSDTSLEAYIIGTYIGDGDKGLNIPSTLRKEVEEFMAAEERVDSFEDHILFAVYHFVLDMLQRDNFMRFIQRQEYIEYMLATAPKC